MPKHPPPYRMLGPFCSYGVLHAPGRNKGSKTGGSQVDDLCECASQTIFTDTGRCGELIVPRRRYKYASKDYLQLYSSGTCGSKGEPGKSTAL